MSLADALLGLGQGFVQGGGIQNVGGLIASRRANEALSQALAPTQPQQQPIATGGATGAPTPQVSLQALQNDARRKQLQLTQRAIRIASLPGPQARNAANILLKSSPLVAQSVNQLTTQAQNVLNRAAQINTQSGTQNARSFLQAVQQSPQTPDEIKALLPNLDDPNLGQNINAMQAAVQTTNDLSKQAIGAQFEPLRVQRFGAEDILTQGPGIRERTPSAALLQERERRLTKQQPQVIETREGRQPLTKGVQTDQQKRLITFQSQLSDLKSIATSADNRDLFSQINRGLNAFSNTLSKSLNIPLNEAEKEFTRRLEQLFTPVETFFNSVRKDVTGAGASIQELEKLKKATINGDLSFEQFDARLKVLISDMERKIAETQKTLTGGVKVRDDQPEQQPQVIRAVNQQTGETIISTDGGATWQRDTTGVQ